MNDKSVKTANSSHRTFEGLRQVDDDGNEFWSARQLAKVLDYSEYRHFLPVVERAKEACRNSEQNIEDHFEDVLEMVEIGSGALRPVNDFRLSRYACYLIVQNGDPSKSVIAAGQTYFAMQTRRQELPAATIDALFVDKPVKLREHFAALWAQTMLPTEQDRLLAALLTPGRLLEFLRFFVLFDRKVGKVVARYQQFFGIRALLKRIQQRRPDGGREGGIVWHTTGSGKSFTMVFLTKALVVHDDLSACRVVVVTDRIDLEDQLARNFISSGAFGSAIATKKEGEKARAQTGRQLAKRIGQGDERIIFTLIHKFATASRQPECYNPSPDLIVLVDEGHRSHGGETHERMKKSLPLASYVAFTGTPLLKKEKASVKLLRGKLLVAVPRRDPSLVRASLEEWYRQRAREIFARRLAELAPRLPWLLKLPSFRLLNMRTQWGSCSPSGELVLNPQLVKAPRVCIDYVIYHELCHLREHNHSPEYYRLLESVMPDWANHKILLDRLAEVLLNR